MRPVFWDSVDKYSPALSDCKFAQAQSCPLQGRNPRSTKRSFVRRVYFTLKRRELREGLAPSLEITASHSLSYSETVRGADSLRA